MINVDITEAMPANLILLMDGEGLSEAVLDDLAEMAWLKWRNLAVRELHSSRQTYVEGIQTPVVAEGGRVITLVGWLPNAIENGIDGFDMRETLLGPNSRVRKPVRDKSGRQIGWYANIPFRHGSPGSSGLAGAPMGSAYAKEGAMSAPMARAFGQSVYAAAKSLRARGSRGRNPTSLPSYQAGDKLREHHSTSIYTGMVRERKPYVNARTGKTTTQSQYTTFRRISTVGGTGWMHPGIEPHNMAQKVVEYVAGVANRVVKTAVAAALKGK